MRRRTLPALALLLAPCLLSADTFPTQERGFQAEKAFQAGDFDTVNKAQASLDSLSGASMWFRSLGYIN